LPKEPRGWQQPFEEPILLPRGRQLVTLEDAGNYITKLPKTEHEAPEWQAAMECLILVAEKNGSDHDGAHRRHAGSEPPRRARVQSRKQRHTLGTAKAGAGSVIARGSDPSRVFTHIHDQEIEFLNVST
jgi:hypothetical protein